MVHDDEREANHPRLEPPMLEGNWDIGNRAVGEDINFRRDQENMGEMDKQFRKISGKT